MGQEGEECSERDIGCMGEVGGCGVWQVPCSTMLTHCYSCVSHSPSLAHITVYSLPPAMLQLPEADFVNTRTSLREVLAMRRKYLEWSHQEFYHTTAKWLDADHEEVDLDISKDQFLLRLGSTGELNLTEQGDLASEGGECCVCVPVRVGSVVCVCCQ